MDKKPNYSGRKRDKHVFFNWSFLLLSFTRMLKKRI